MDNQEPKLQVNSFKPGDRVKWWNGFEWITGEITIVKDLTCKVLWDSQYDYDYDYWPMNLLWKIE